MLSVASATASVDPASLSVVVPPAMSSLHPVGSWSQRIVWKPGPLTTLTASLPEDRVVAHVERGRDHLGRS